MTVKQEVFKELVDAINLSKGLLEDASGNINPERGYCYELEEEIRSAIERLAEILIRFGDCLEEDVAT